MIAEDSKTARPQKRVVDHAVGVEEAETGCVRAENREIILIV